MTQTKIILMLLGAVILSLVLSMGASHYSRLKEAAAQNETRKGVLIDATAGVEDGRVNEQAQHAIDLGLGIGRKDFLDAIEKANRNEPETANRSDRTVPDSVRNAYAERRRARERLGCAGGECRTGREADAAE